MCTPSTLSPGPSPAIAVLLSSRSLTYPVCSVCPGQFFADATLWLGAANIVATMDLAFAKDPKGKEIVPEAAFISGFVRYDFYPHAISPLTKGLPLRRSQSPERVYVCHQPTVSQRAGPNRPYGRRQHRLLIMCSCLLSALISFFFRCHIASWPPTLQSSSRCFLVL